MACGDSVARVMGQASTRRSVFNDTTFGVEAASSRARIFTFIIHARLAKVAVRVGNALRPTTRIRVPEVFGQAGARSGTISLFTNGVSSAR